MNVSFIIINSTESINLSNVTSWVVFIAGCLTATIIWIAKDELKMKSNIDNLFLCYQASENITLSMNTQQCKYLLIVLVWQ